MSTPAQFRRLRHEAGELIARHRTTDPVESFARFAEDPVGFAKRVLRVKLWSKQQEIAELVRTDPRTAVRSSNGAGKDYAAAAIALWWVLARDGIVLLTGPTSRQVKQILMRYVGQMFRTARNLPGELYALALRVADEDRIIALTTDSMDAATGFHHPRLLVVLTEAQGVEDSAFEAALACATSEGNRVLALANPLRNTGFFYRASHSPNWTPLRIGASDHPNVIEGREVIPGGITRAWVEMMAREYGRDSHVFRARVEAEFPEESIESLVRREWLDAAAGRHESGAFELEAQAEDVQLILDVSRFGRDRCVLGVRQGPVLRRFHAWRETDLMTTARIAKEHANRFAELRRTPFEVLRWMPKIIADDAGLGGGAVDAMRDSGLHVRDFNGGRGARDDRRYLNARAESYFLTRQVLERGQLALPRDEELFEELLATFWTTSPSGKIQIERKDDIRARLGRSPDKADVVAMSEYYAPSRNRTQSVHLAVT